MTTGLDRLTNGHALAPEAPGAVELCLAQGTQDFLRDLMQNLASALQPVESRWIDEQSAFIAGFLGVPEVDQTRLVRQSEAWAASFVLVGVDAVLKSAPYVLRDVVDFGYGGRAVPTYRSIEVAPDETREVMVNGWYVLHADDVPIMVHVTVSHDRSVFLTTIVATQHKEVGVALLKAVDDYPNFYRGQVITVDEFSEPSFLAVPKVEFDDVIFEPQIWAALEQQVLEFVEMEQVFKLVHLPFRRGVILAGPPGVGKTLVFRALSHRLAGRCTVIWVTARSIPEPAAVKRVFELARALAPTLMLWEDVDLTVRGRADSSGAVLGELLAQLDGPGSSEGVITCASTNDPSVLDEALSTRASRFDRIVNVGLPSVTARRRMLERFVSDIPTVTADLDRVAAEAAEMTGADLRELVITAFAEAQRGSGDRSAPAPLASEHFQSALAQLGDARRAARQSGVRRKGGRKEKFGFTA